MCSTSWALVRQMRWTRKCLRIRIALVAPTAASSSISCSRGWGFKLEARQAPAPSCLPSLIYIVHVNPQTRVSCFLGAHAARRRMYKCGTVSPCIGPSAPAFVRRVQLLYRALQHAHRFLQSCICSARSSVTGCLGRSQLTSWTSCSASPMHRKVLTLPSLVCKVRPSANHYGTRDIAGRDWSRHGLLQVHQGRFCRCV